MRIYLFTHTYPIRSDGEASFLHPEVSLVGREMESFGITEFVIVPMSITGPSRDVQVELPTNISIDWSFVETRIAIRRYRLLGVLLASLTHLYTLVQRDRSPLRNLRNDFISLLTWADNQYLMTKTLKRSDLAEKLRGAIAYTYWADGYTDSLSRFVRRNTTEFKDTIVVSRAHGGDVLRDQIMQVNLQERLRYLNRIFTSSNVLSDYLVSEEIPKGLLQVAPLGVNVSSMAEQYPLDTNSLLPGFDPIFHQLIISVSSDHPVKRLNKLQKILYMCSEMGQPIYWLHIGATIRKDQFSTTYFSMNSIPPRPHAEVLHILTNLRKSYMPILFNFSLSEGVPISLVEGGMLGIPLLATAVGGTPSLFEQSTSGLLPVDADVNDVMAQIVLIRKDYENLSLLISSHTKSLFETKKSISLFYESLLNL